MTAARDMTEAGTRHFRLRSARETTSSRLAGELRRLAPHGTTEGSLFVPSNYLTLPGPAMTAAPDMTAGILHLRLRTARETTGPTGVRISSFRLAGELRRHPPHGTAESLPILR